LNNLPAKSPGFCFEAYSTTDNFLSYHLSAYLSPAEKIIAKAIPFIIEYMLRQAVII
jgi:hypothetical protein